MINTLSKINLSKIGWEGGGSTSIWIMSLNILLFFFDVTPKYALTDGKAKHFNPLLQQMLIVLIPANMQMQKHADTCRLIVNIQG